MAVFGLAISLVIVLVSVAGWYNSHSSRDWAVAVRSLIVDLVYHFASSNGEYYSEANRELREVENVNARMRRALTATDEENRRLRSSLTIPSLARVRSLRFHEVHGDASMKLSDLESRCRGSGALVGGGSYRLEYCTLLGDMILARPSEAIHDECREILSLAGESGSETARHGVVCSLSRDVLKQVGSARWITRRKYATKFFELACNDADSPLETPSFRGCLMAGESINIVRNRVGAVQGDVRKMAEDASRYFSLACYGGEPSGCRYLADLYGSDNGAAVVDVKFVSVALLAASCYGGDSIGCQRLSKHPLSSRQVREILREMPCELPGGCAGYVE